MSEKVCTTIIIAKVVGYDGKSTTSYHMPGTAWELSRYYHIINSDLFISPHQILMLSEWDMPRWIKSNYMFIEQSDNLWIASW